MMRCLGLAALCVACARPVPSAGPPAKDPAGEIFAELVMGSHGPLENERLERYVRAVGARVAPRGNTWHFRITDDPQPAANALPGGSILVSRGALALLGSEAELAAVLAHELAHATRGHTALDKTALPAHGVDGAARAAALDADEERQADALAVELVARAGYDPRAVGRALDALHRGVGDVEHDPTDPHPPRAARLARVALVAGRGRGEEGRARYLGAIDGLPLGTDDAHLESGRFHAPGGLSFALPPGFRPELSGHVLTARALDAELTIVRFHGRFFREALLGAVRRSTFSSREVAGLRTLVGTLGDDAAHRVAVLDSSPFVYIIAASGSGRDEQVERVLASARAARVGPRLVLRIARAPGGVSASRLCPDTDPSLFERLNGFEANAVVSRGFSVKCTTTR